MAQEPELEARIEAALAIIEKWKAQPSGRWSGVAMIEKALKGETLYGFPIRIDPTLGKDKIRLEGKNGEISIFTAEDDDTEVERLKSENRGHLANNENLAASCKQYERRAVMAEAKIEAALAIAENDPYDPRLERAEAMAQALKGEHD